MTKIPYTISFITLFSLGLLFGFGRLRELFRKLVECWKDSSNLHGYAPISLGFEDFYFRRVYLRAQ
ncbi:hypothetical protein MKW98_023165, partial [Papaver atlanticum]